MKMKLKRSLAAVLTCALTFGACACSSNTESGYAEKELEELTVVLDWYPNGSHVFLYNAIEEGYYEEEGLKIKVEFPSNTNDAISMTSAGKADIGFYYMHDVIQANANQDIPVVSIGAAVQNPVNVLMSLESEGITSVEDLKGKKIGYGGSVLNEAFVYTMLKSAGLEKTDVELIDVGFELMSSMTTGQVNATIGGFVSHEVPELENQGFKVNYIKPTDNGVPEYTELVFVTSKSTCESKKDALTRFLKATQKSFEDVKSNPGKGVDNLLKNQNTENFPLNKDVETKSVNTIISLAEKDGAPFLSQSEETWKKNIDWMLESGVITRSVNASDMIVKLV